MTFRSNRAEQFEQIRKELKDCGYVTWRIFYSRFAMYRVLIVAVNQLAVTIGHEPTKVYQAVCAAVGRSVRGTKFGKPYLAKAKHGRVRRTESCPHCGGDLLCGLETDGSTSKPAPKEQSNATVSTTSKE